MVRNVLRFRLLLFAFAFSWRTEDMGSPCLLGWQTGWWTTLRKTKEKWGNQEVVGKLRRSHWRRGHLCNLPTDLPSEEVESSMVGGASSGPNWEEVPHIMSPQHMMSKGHLKYAIPRLLDPPPPPWFQTCLSPTLPHLPKWHQQLSKLPKTRPEEGPWGPFFPPLPTSHLK